MSRLDQFFGSGPRVWVSGATYAIGNVLLSPADNYQQYVRITDGAGATDPASDTTNYRPFGGRAKKSIQRGIITIASGASSGTATISAVTTSKSELRFLGWSGSSTLASGHFPKLELTNGTTVTASTGGGIAVDRLVSWELTEYY